MDVDEPKREANVAMDMAERAEEKASSTDEGVAQGCRRYPSNCVATMYDAMK